MQRAKVRTLSINPQQGPGVFPISEGAAFGEPQSGALVMSIERNAVIYGRIWRRKPVHSVSSRLVPCECLSHQQCVVTSSFCAPIMTLLPISFTLSSSNMPSTILILSSTTFSVSCTPSTLSLTWFPTPCIAFRASAAAIRASSTVTFSSLCSASSISFFPKSFFRKFSGDE